jgi:protein-disulfide isomerase
LLAVAALLVAVGAGIAIALMATRGNSSSTVPARGSLHNALPGAADVQRLFAGIHQSGNVLGSPSAPVTMVEYIDLQCPFCRAFSAGALPKLVSRYVRTGKLRIETRPIAFIGPDSQLGRQAAIAAGEEGRLSNFATLLYFNQGPENTGWLNDNLITAAAASIPGLDVPRLLSDRGSPTVVHEVETFDAQARADRVDQTPTILVGRTGSPGRPVTLSSSTDVNSVVAAIDRALRG